MYVVGVINCISITKSLLYFLSRSNRWSGSLDNVRVEREKFTNLGCRIRGESDRGPWDKMVKVEVFEVEHLETTIGPMSIDGLVEKGIRSLIGKLLFDRRVGKEIVHNTLMKIW